MNQSYLIFFFFTPGCTLLFLRYNNLLYVRIHACWGRFQKMEEWEASEICLLISTATAFWQNLSAATILGLPGEDLDGNVLVISVTFSS